MKRRDFLKAASSSGILLTLPWPVMTFDAISNRSIHPVFSPEDFPLAEITIGELRQKFAQGVYTSRMVTELYLKRIEAIDKNGPALNAIIEVNADALSIADQRDTERKNGKIRGPLHGIPVLVKDNIDTADGMMTTAGSLALRGYRAREDAFLVKKLREAGAVLLGKTNLSEWANFRSTRSSSGWSSRGGQTKNPYILNRNPCGSSSGSGVAVSANLCAIAIGTETNGSIVCPSSINGIVGVKPTVGLVSRSGIIPISHRQDTAGPMARTVTDAAIVLTAIAGTDPRDAETQHQDTKPQDYTRFLDANGLKGKRIGVEKSLLKKHEGVDALVAEAIEVMRSKGAEIVEVELLSKIKLQGAGYTLLQYEFKDGLNRYLSRANAPVRSLSDVIAFNLEHEKEAMPFFRQEILESSNEKGGLDSQEYNDALKKIAEVRAIITEVMTTNNLQSICGPTNGPSWCTDLVNGDHFSGYGTYSPASQAGFPHITVPMGTVNALPVGLTFISTAFREPDLFAIAYAYEQASRKRIAPGFLPALQD